MSFESRNPTTGEVIARYPEHTPAEVEACLARAWSGWESWSVTPLTERSAFLNRLADVLEGRVDEFARLITLEMGNPYAEAQAEVKKAASGARHFATTGPTYIEPQVIAGTPGQVIFQPLGPVLGIMPWNLPFWQVLRFFIPAALVGNTVLVKHAESVKGCAIALERLVRDAGGPDGLYVNLMVDRKAVAGLRDTVRRQVEDAVRQGARILTGGNVVPGPGYFFEPTVLTGLRHDAPIVAEECFGSVALLFPVRGDAEAIRLANATEYGLGAAVWSADLARAQRVATEIEAGAVFINDFVRSDPRAPFGGVKNSGFGRELGALGARELANAKLVWQG